MATEDIRASGGGSAATPVGAIWAGFIVMVISVIALGFVFRQPILSAWGWTGFVGTLIVLVAYILATIGAARMLRQNRTRTRPGRRSGCRSPPASGLPSRWSC
jgi:amino acid transporter